MNKFASELKTADSRQKALLLAGIRGKLTEEPIESRLYPDLVLAVGGLTSSSDVNVKRNALSALVLVLASLKGDTLDYEFASPALLAVLPKVISAFALGSKEEIEAAQRSVQLIYDMIPIASSTDASDPDSASSSGWQGSVNTDSLIKCIAEGLGPKAKPNTQVAVLNSITEGVNRLGEDFAVMIAAALGSALIRMMDASIGTVREAVPAALQAVYRYSPTMRDRVGSSTLRRDEKEKLKKYFDQADADGETVLHSSDAYEKSLLLSELAESASSTSLAGSSSGDIGLNRSGNGITKSSSTSNLVASLKTIKSIAVNSEEELRKEFADIVAKLSKVEKHDWEGKVAKMERFQGLILGGATDQANFMEVLKPFLAVFKALLKESRAAILDGVCRAISVLAQTAGERVGPFIDKLMKELMVLLFATNIVVADLGTTCVSHVLRVARPPNAGTLICEEAVFNQKNKHISTRAKCVAYIQQLIQEGSIEYVDKWCDLFFKTIKSALSDPDGTVRSNARRAFAEFCKRWASKGRTMWSELDAAAQTALKKDGLGLDDDSIRSLGSSTGSISHTRLNSSSGSLPITITTSPTHLSETSSITHSESSSSLGSEKSDTAPSAPSSLVATTITAQTATTGKTTSAKRVGQVEVKKSAATGMGGASRTVTTKPESSIPANTSKPIRMVPTQQATSSTELQTPIRKKPVSSNTLVPKITAAPIQTKSHSVSTLNTGSLSALDAHDATIASLPTITSPGRGNYNAASSDTSKFRNMLKRCDLDDIHERTAAMEELKTLLISDQLPGLWPNATLCQSFITMLTKRLGDAQVKILQSTLEMVKVVSCDQVEVWDNALEALAPPLIQLAFSELGRDDFKAEAQALIVSLAGVSASRLFAVVKKVIESPDAKPKLNAVRSLTLFIPKMESYFDKQPLRIQKFITMMTIKPNDIRASTNMTKAVTDVFALLYASLGEQFATQLRTSKFTGQDTVMKKLKVPATAPKAAPSTGVGAVSALKKTGVSVKPSSSVNAKNSTITAKTNASIKPKMTAPAVIAVGPTRTVSANGTIIPKPQLAVTPTKETQRARPVLQRQKSTSDLPSSSKKMYDTTLANANADLVRESLVNPSPSSGTPNTPTREELRQEIRETPNVLLTVMRQPVIISPLTPIATRHGGTPSFVSLGRSTSTPQLRSVKYSGRKPDVTALIEVEEGGLGIFSPPKFSLDSAIATPPRGPEPTPLKSLLDSLSTQIQKESPQWDSADQTLKLLHSALGNVSADHLLQSLDNEGLLLKLECCLDRSHVPLKLRQAACNVVALLKDRVPARDWEPHFAKLDDRHQRLLSGFMKKTSSSQTTAEKSE